MRCLLARGCAYHVLARGIDLTFTDDMLSDWFCIWPPQAVCRVLFSVRLFLSDLQWTGSLRCEGGEVSVPLVRRCLRAAMRGMFFLLCATLVLTVGTGSRFLLSAVVCPTSRQWLQRRRSRQHVLGRICSPSCQARKTLVPLG